MKKCPFCAEKVQNKAIICKHCKKDLPIEKSFIERQNEKIELKKAKEKAYVEGLPEEERATYLLETKRKRNLNIIWWSAGILAIIFYAEHPWIAFFIIFAAIWLHPKKDQDVFQNRFKRIKEYKARIGCSILVLFIAYVNHTAISENKRIENYPVPQIEILSGVGDQGASSEYELKIKAKNTEEILVGDQVMVKEDGEGDIFHLKVPLDTSSTSLNIIAKNDYKESKKAIVITRDKTEEDLKKEKLAEEEKLAKEKLAEEAKLAKEAEANDAYKVKIQREIDDINDGFDSAKFRGTVDNLVLEAILFSNWANVINEAKQHTDPEILKLAEQLERLVSQLQVKEFPIMRKEYGEVTGKLLWESDIEVKIAGSSNNTVEFTGGLFAANANIKQAYDIAAETLKLLRFDTANYKWFEYDNDYTIFTIESNADNEVIETK